MKKNTKTAEKQGTKAPRKIRMKGDVLVANCPSRRILNNLTSKWSVLIFFVLANGEVKRFSEIRNSIDGISEKMLTQTLKALEQDQLIVRKSYNVVPPYVEYSLTEIGMDAAKNITGLVGWIENNLSKILR